MFKVVVFCNAADAFEVKKKQLHQLLPTEEIIFGDSTKFSREFLINQNLGSWILFLDHDCELTPEAVERINTLTTFQRESPRVFAGNYLNPVGATPLQRAHNLIANAWLSHSHSGEEKSGYVLGGIFLIHALKTVEVPKNLFWGAEDKLLSSHLKSAGYSLNYQEKLNVIHHTSSAFGHFVKRAVLHGRNDIIYFEKAMPVSVFYWIRKIDFADLPATFLVLLHFCIQKAAKLIQRIRLMSRPRS